MSWWFSTNSVGEAVSSAARSTYWRPHHHQPTCRSQKVCCSWMIAAYEDVRRIWLRTQSDHWIEAEGGIAKIRRNGLSFITWSATQHLVVHVSVAAAQLRGEEWHTLRIVSADFLTHGFSFISSIYTRRCIISSYVFS
ncbi:uncharacterized protein [Aegilops tauschii subsp. strangulata]|uniref:uncharacterized protein isoform X2 n=1 Tax=Aegilops tauschii subsp. strangulata TaxID=200361 RepID=UPI003CC86B43